MPRAEWKDRKLQFVVHLWFAYVWRVVAICVDTSTQLLFETNDKNNNKMQKQNRLLKAKKMKKIKNKS